LQFDLAVILLHFFIIATCMFIVIIETVREYVMGSGEQRGTKGGE
jgi:hypothetical protein